MASARIGRVLSARQVRVLPRRMPNLQQRRTFLPKEYTDPKVLEQQFPSYPELDVTQDPDMVC